MKHISSIKPKVEKGLYALVKRPDNKAEPLVELSKTIKNFQDEKDDHFLNKLKNRVPSSSSYKLESRADFGLSKRSPKTSVAKVEAPDQSSNIINDRFKNTKSFKISNGVPGLNKHYQKLAPKTNYNYTDPQFYEYKLKGKTIKDMQLSAFKAQGATDLDGLDPVEKYKVWRQQDLDGKVSKIQSLVRGRSVRENLAEGTALLPEEDDGDIDVREVITAGKAKRKDKHIERQERSYAKNEMKELEELYELDRQARAHYEELDKKERAELAKREKRIKFLEDSGIEEYAKKGQKTKATKSAIINNSITKLQKTFRGHKSRKDNKEFIEESAKRFLIQNPSNKDQTIYVKPRVSPQERSKIFRIQRNDRTARQREEEEKGKIAAYNAHFLDETTGNDDEVPAATSLKEKLGKAYPKNDNKDSKGKNKNMREAWLKKQEELNAKQENEKYFDQSAIEQIHTLKTEISQFEQLQELVNKSNKGKTKVTPAMKLLIPTVYGSFGKNVGTNSNRNVSTVLKELEGWADAKTAKEQKVEDLKSTQSSKFKEIEAKKKKAKEDDKKVRVPPATSNKAVTLSTITKNAYGENESSGGGGRIVPKK